MDKENNWSFILGAIFVVAVICAVVCGILECFSINTGPVGGVAALILAVPISLYLLYVFIRYLIK